MDIKVCDIVKYQGQTVRVLQLETDPDNHDGKEIKLAGFGWFKKRQP